MAAPVGQQQANQQPQIFEEEDENQGANRRRCTVCCLATMMIVAGGEALLALSKPIARPPAPTEVTQAVRAIAQRVGVPAENLQVATGSYSDAVFVSGDTVVMGTDFQAPFQGRLNTKFTADEAAGVVGFTLHSNQTDPNATFSLQATMDDAVSFAERNPELTRGLYDVTSHWRIESEEKKSTAAEEEIPGLRERAIQGSIATVDPDDCAALARQFPTETFIRGYGSGPITTGNVTRTIQQVSNFGFRCIMNLVRKAICRRAPAANADICP